MSVETFDVAQAITVTPAAAEHFAHELAKKGSKAVRIGLKESGCTGFKYIIDEVDSPETEDHLLTLENGVQLYLDQRSIAALSGTVIDYVQQGLNKNLVLNNPNVKDMCGCGESFSIE